MSNAAFEPDYNMLSHQFNSEELDVLQEKTESIRDLLVFDDETEKVIALAPGGFTHNIIGLTLQEIAKKLNDEVAQSVLDGFGLEKLGW